MLQSIDNGRAGFLCPQCHQDMSNMEMLQVHFQNVHMKQASSSTTSKGFFTLAKQKIKSVQDNFKTPNEPLKPYAQYFLFNPNDQYSKQQHMGYTSSHDDLIKTIRKKKRDEMFHQTDQLLIRLQLLTAPNEHIPPNRNTKERRKYELSIVPWVEDSITSQCGSCSKSFGISKRKHHCRLDGRVICSQCSRLLSFSIARDIVDPTASPLASATNTVPLQRLINLSSLISSTNPNNGSNDDSLRICLGCEYALQRYHNQIRYKHIPVDPIFHLYDKILHAEKEYKNIQSTYGTMIDSLLNGNTQYQLTDAQRVYRELSVHYDKIDSTSKLIVKLADNDSVTTYNRYAALCRNIRTYSIQILQNFSISTRHLPTEEDIKRVRDEKKRLEVERMIKFAANIPGMKNGLSEISPKLEPFVQQYYRVAQFLEEAKLAGRQDEINLLEMNLKELEQAIRKVDLN
ncbi:hypothetical protein I4U23_014175 [Adineta vaga]|nr:hypothetical protein I4U23_014175 [Adineta vaga]